MCGAGRPSQGRLSLTQRRSVGYQDVYAFGNEVPLLEQRLASREVKTPAVKPGLPVGEEHVGQRGPPRVGAVTRQEKQATVPNGHQGRPDAQNLPSGERWGFTWT